MAAPNNPFQQITAVIGKHRAVRVFNVAVKMSYPSGSRSPRHNRKRSGVGKKKQVGLCDIPETFYRRCIKGYTVLKRPRQLIRHYRDVFLYPKKITKPKPDELHIVFINKLQHFVCRCIHALTSCSYFFSLTRGPLMCSTHPDVIVPPGSDRDILDWTAYGFFNKPDVPHGRLR